MSTEKVKIMQKINKNKRFSDIASMGESVFHLKDLANLWNIRNKNTLYKTLSRYVASGLIYRIYNGLYSVKKIKDLDPYLLGVKAMRGDAYVSCESVLFDQGIVNQPPREITLVGKISKRFHIGGQKFRSRKLRDDFLFNSSGIEVKNGARMASVERAVADMFYFSPKKYLDAFNSNLIDWKKVNKISEDMGYNIKIPKKL